MVSIFPYWDMAFWSGFTYTWGSVSSTSAQGNRRSVTDIPGLVRHRWRMGMGSRRLGRDLGTRRELR